MSHPANALDTPAGRRLLAALRDACAGLPEVDEIIDGFGHTTFKVRKKSFVIAGMGEDGHDVAIKSDLPTQETLVRHGRWFRTPYIGHHGWVSIRDPQDQEWPDVRDLIRDAYRLAAPRSLRSRAPDS